MLPVHFGAVLQLALLTLGHALEGEPVLHQLRVVPTGHGRGTVGQACDKLGGSNTGHCLAAAKAARGGGNYLILYY
jgi:hypothetical protein